VPSASIAAAWSSMSSQVCRVGPAGCGTLHP
jgi:hypothetical protein